MTREFLLIARKAPTSADLIDLGDLYNSGRFHIVCQFITNCIWISNNLREDTIVYVSLNGPREPPKFISINPKELKELHEDEKSVARVFKEVLSGKKISGVGLSNQSFEGFLKERKNKNEIFYLDKKGESIDILKSAKNPLFVIGDYIGFSKNQARFFERSGAKALSLGRTVLFASQCPVILNYEMDKSFYKAN